MVIAALLVTGIIAFKMLLVVLGIALIIAAILMVITPFTALLFTPPRRLRRSVGRHPHAIGNEGVRLSRTGSTVNVKLDG